MSGALCAHCGAPASTSAQDRPAPPVPEAAAPAPLPGAGFGPVAAAGSLVGSIRSRLVPGVEAVVHKQHPVWQWRAAAAVLVVALLLLGVLMVRSCSLPSPPGGFGSPGIGAGPAQVLPGALATASCTSSDPASGVEQCVIAAGDPLLSGGITGGRDLPLRVQTVRPEALTQTVRGWRAAGGEVLSDDVVFVSISAASAVLYADTESGLRIDTGTFSNSAAAQTFLSRSGFLDD